MKDRSPLGTNRAFPDGVVTCTLEMIFDGSVESEALRVLKTLVYPVRAERGCLGTRLCHDVGGEKRVIWISRWDRWEAFECHVRTAHFRLLLGVIEMAARKPTIMVENSVDRRGVEVIEEILVAEGRA